MELPILRRTIYEKKEFIEALDKAGLADTLGVMLDNAPVLIREQWYSNQMIDITDPRVVAFFNAANIDLQSLFTK